MSYIENLLKGAEVEWTTIGDATFVEIANSGRKPVKSDLRIAGEIPYYGANNIQDYVEGFTHNGDYILIAEDGTASIENYSIQYAVGKFWANNHVHVIRGKNKLNSRFLYHYLQIVNFIPFLSGGGRAKLTKGKLLDIPIPIPPSEVQKEIVRILDTFTALTAELTAELTARKKQYEYYRGKLLNFNDSNSKCECLSIRELCEFTNGKGHEKDIVDYGNYIVVNSKFISTDSKVAKYSNKQISPLFIDDVLIVMSDLPNGRALAKTFLVDKNDRYTLNQRIGRISVKDKRVLLPKFLNYNLNRTSQLTKFDNGADQTNLRKDQILDVKIPVPPIEEQERIVAILDKFDTLTNSISEGLPKEIELRQKQYEYYREQLLTFPEPSKSDY